MVEVIEVVLGEFVLRLDGTVVEVLHRTGSSSRFHVEHVAIEARPKGRDTRARLRPVSRRISCKSSLKE